MITTEVMIFVCGVSIGIFTATVLLMASALADYIREEKELDQD